MITLIQSLHILYTLSVGFYSSEKESYIGVNFRPEGSLYYEQKNFFETSFDIEVLSPKKHFFIGGQFINHAKIEDRLPFTPIEGLYYSKCGIRLDKIEIGYTHYCRHPIASHYENKIGFNRRYSASDKWYITFSNNL